MSALHGMVATTTTWHHAATQLKANATTDFIKELYCDIIDPVAPRSVTGKRSTVSMYIALLSAVIQKVVGQSVLYASASASQASASASTTDNATPVQIRVVSRCAEAAGPTISVNTSKTPTICAHSATASATRRGTAPR